MKFLERCLGILYPQTCCFCGKVSKTPICTDCSAKVEYVREPRCKKCGKPIRYAEQEFCLDCVEHLKNYEQGRSVWLHKGVVRKSIYQFKYHNRRIYGEFYAEEMYRLYGKQIRDWGIQAIIPIPLHKRRQRRRGYNQAEIVARHLGILTGVPLATKVVLRMRQTKPQKELSHKERKKNLEHAFVVSKDWECVQNILLIDDIYTTGNTIDAVASVLKKKGVLKVFFLTISIGQGF